MAKAKMHVLEPKPHAEDVNIGLERKDRKEIATQLSGILADTYKLLIKTHLYHWNVVGPLFYSLHKMTEEQYEALFKATDTIAERIRAIGFLAPVSNVSGLVDTTEELSDEMPSARQMVENLVSDHEEALRKMRETAVMAEEKEDIVTHDMLIAQMSFHSEAAWMLRSIVTE